MFCLLHAGIGSEEETVHDSTPDSLESGVRFGVKSLSRGWKSLRARPWLDERTIAPPTRHSDEGRLKDH